MSLKKNDVITLEVTDINNRGYGVAKYCGMAVFIDGAVTGDTVSARIIKTASSYAVARIEKMERRSPERVEARCSAKKCGGCVYRCISYGYELEIKRNSAAASFRRARLKDVNILPVIPSPRVTRYRNKAQYPVSCAPDGRLVAGFYSPASHSVCEVEDCALQPEIFGRITGAVLRFAEEHGVRAYDENTGEGLLRHIYLRHAEATGEIMLTLVINGSSFPHSEELCRMITKEYPSVKSILLNENIKKTNVILGDKYTLLYGVPYINDVLCGVRLRISAPSFYQVNRGAAEILYGKAAELCELTGGETVLDLYCGIGSIGLSMAKEAGRIIGIEISAPAVECARENARQNGFENAFFFAGDAKDARGLISQAETHLGSIAPDVVILDPPRKGCDKDLLDYISEMDPDKIIYISCNTETLARDCAVMKEKGYSLSDVVTVDLFPGTGHVEAVVRLKRR